MTVTVTPRVGLVFRHARHLTPTATAKNPEYEVCRVTAIRRDRVYYGHGADATRGQFYCTVEGFPAVVGDVLKP